MENRIQRNYSDKVKNEIHKIYIAQISWVESLPSKSYYKNDDIENEIHVGSPSKRCETSKKKSRK